MLIRYSIGLFPMVQRYKFESKSQRYFSSFTTPDGCSQWFKDTNLKVNHNGGLEGVFYPVVVSNGSKIQI